MSQKNNIDQDNTGGNSAKTDGSSAPAPIRSGDTVDDLPVVNAPEPQRRKVVVPETMHGQPTEHVDISPDKESADKGRRHDIIDRENRATKFTSAMIAAAIVTAVAIIAVLIFVVLQLNQPEPVDTPAISEEQVEDPGFFGATGVADTGNFISKLASENGFNIDGINYNPKQVVTENNTVRNSSSPRVLSFSAPTFTLEHTNNCTFETRNDFCYAAELHQDGNLVGNVYAFSNLLETKFFAENGNVSAVPVPGAEFSYAGQVKVSGKTENAAFVLDENGSGYAIVVHENGDINKLVSQGIGYNLAEAVE